MGIIQRQGLKHSIVTYVGVVLGLINVLFIYTHAFSEEELGIIRYLIMAGNLIVPLALLGTSVVSVKYFPIFKNASKGHHGFLGLLLMIASFGFLIFGTLSYFYGGIIMDFLKKKSDLFQDYLPYIIVLTFALMFARILTNYVVNFHRIVVPSLFNDLLIKIAVPSLALLYAWQYIPFDRVIKGITIAYLIPIPALIFYIWRLGHLKLKINFAFLKKPLVKEMTSYATFGILGGMGINLANQIDILMAGSLMGLKSAGIYSIALFIANVIEVPKRSIISITGPIISEHWSKKNLVKIQELYQQTSITLLSFGLLLFIGVWASLDLLFLIMPNGESYASGKYVVLILGLAKLVDLATSINTNIISYSEKYRFNLYVILIMAGLNIGANLLLIPRYGLLGVALATLTSVFLYNTIRSLFVYFEFNMHPFSWKTLQVIGIGLVAYSVSLLIPAFMNPYIGIILKSISIASIYCGAMIYWNISPDFSKLLSNVLIIIRKRFKLEK